MTSGMFSLHLKVAGQAITVISDGTEAGFNVIPKMQEYQAVQYAQKFAEFTRHTNGTPVFVKDFDSTVVINYSPVGLFAAVKHMDQQGVPCSITHMSPNANHAIKEATGKETVTTE